MTEVAEECFQLHTGSLHIKIRKFCELKVTLLNLVGTNCSRIPKSYIISACYIFIQTVLAHLV